MTDPSPLETLLADTLAERADALTPAVRTHGALVHDAPPGRRTRPGLVALAAVVALVVLGAGLVVVRLREGSSDGVGPVDAPSATDPSTRADPTTEKPRIPYAAGSRVVLPDGRVLDVAVPGGIASLHQVGTAYLATDANYLEGSVRLYRVGADDGDGADDAPVEIGFTSGPVVFDDDGERAAWVTYVPPGMGETGELDLVLHVADTATGQERTSSPVGLPDVESRVVGWLGDRVVVAPTLQDDEGLVAVDVTDGSTSPVGAVQAVAPRTGLVATAVRDRSGIVVSDPDGTQLWKHPQRYAEPLGFSADGTKLLVEDGRLGGRYEVRDARTGEVLWVPPFPIYSGLPSPAVQLVWEDDDHLLVVELGDQADEPGDPDEQRVVRVGSDERMHEVLPPRAGGYRLLRPWATGCARRDC